MYVGTAKLVRMENRNYIFLAQTFAQTVLRMQVAAYRQTFIGRFTYTGTVHGR